MTCFNVGPRGRGSGSELPFRRAVSTRSVTTARAVRNGTGGVLVYRMPSYGALWDYWCFEISTKVMISVGVASYARIQIGHSNDSHTVGVHELGRF